MDVLKHIKKILPAKKAMGGIAAGALELGIAAIVIGVVFTMLDKLQGTQTANSYAYNATGTIQTNVKTMVDFIPVIVIALLATIVLGYLGIRNLFGGQA